MDNIKAQSRQEIEDLHKQIAELRVLETEYKNLQEKKIEASAIIEGMLDVVLILDLDGTIRQVNTEFERGTGWKREEVIGKTPLEIGILSKEEEQKLRKELLPKLLKEGFVRNIERTVIRKDGTKFPVLTSWTLMKDAQGKPFGIISVTRDITRLKQVEENFKEYERKYQKVFENAIEGIVMIDVKTRKFLHVNPAICQMLGYKEVEMLQMRIEDIHPKEDLPYIISKLEGPPRKGGTLLMNIPLLRKDGSMTYTDISGQGKILISNRCCKVAFIRDITERRDVEQKLRNERDKAQKFLDIAGVMIIMIGADNKIHLINKKGCQILGYEEKDIVGKNWFKSFIPKRLCNQVKTTFEKIMNGETECIEHFENPILTKSGEERIISWHNSLLHDQQGTVVGVLCSGEDITEHKRSQQALEAYAKELDKQKKVLEEKNIALREVLGQLEVEKTRMQEDIIANIDELILPIVKRLQLKGASKEYMALLESNLKDITSSFGRKITKKIAKLTSREIEICSMLKNGLTSKEISNLLNISFQTVSKHRKNIRKKLLISKKDINLHSFLQQL
ncbi:MAG: PAS domain S-box protein [bacterium]